MALHRRNGTEFEIGVIRDLVVKSEPDPIANGMGSRIDKVLDTLEASPGPLSREELALATGLYVQQVGLALKSLEKFGLVRRTGEKWYVTRSKAT